MSVSANDPIQTWDFGKNTYDWNVFQTFLDTYFIPYLQTAQDKKYKVGAKVPEQYVLWDADVRADFADLIIDLNGERNPNRRSRDMFVIRLSSSPAYKDFGFAGAIYNRSGMIAHTHCCSHTAAGNRYTYCGVLIQSDNWQIKDDYPW